ncbi:PREDICTED: putative nuclease HARBI1 isoform X1 [Rhagoletis zephyria]|uniref:putative nuclease HARBI1 isoform X1 n=1 Tax=Rhagoletis zephyria TaxID=28612 RepID=UPI0008115E31|nr:PREDICTED: putative nuclease HARBI1 isoform X1 [Rhagoletis zephyria]
MDAKVQMVKKIIMSRRLLATTRVSEEAKVCSAVLRHLQDKHLLLLEELDLLYALNESLGSERRLIWKKERTQSFFEKDCQKGDEVFFKNNFRISRQLFYKLCELLPDLRKSDTNMREAIPLEKRVAIALYALGSSSEYRTIANMFGVGKATVCKILLDFCNEVWRVLAPIYLKNFPLTEDKIKGLVQEFETYGFPQCMGALDGCHIEIHPPKEDATDYHNYKGWYSIVLLALVDARCRFIYVSSGSPGRCNDSQIFQTSSLKQQLDECVLLSELKKTISDVDVPVFIIGDSAFRLSDKLMKPYPFHISQSRQQKLFNYRLSKSRRVVENAFGHLKARFRRIGKGIDNSIKNANAIILSCCVLHNFLNENNDKINEKWMQALQVVEANRAYPEYVAVLAEQRNNPESIRNAISSYLSLAEVDGAGESSDIFGDGSGEAIVMGGDGTGEITGMDGDGSGEVIGMDGDGSGEVAAIDGDGSGEAEYADGEGNGEPGIEHNDWEFMS